MKWQTRITTKSTKHTKSMAFFRVFRVFRGYPSGLISNFGIRISDCLRLTGARKLPSIYGVWTE
jgi:hypothetical protein